VVDDLLARVLDVVEVVVLRFLMWVLVLVADVVVDLFVVALPLVLGLSDAFVRHRRVLDAGASFCEFKCGLPSNRSSRNLSVKPTPCVLEVSFAASMSSAKVS